MASRTCVEEVNRLRQKYRLDLPTYDLPAKKSGKRKMTGIVNHVPPKKLRVEETVSLTDQQTDTPAKHPKNDPPQSKHAGQSKRNSKKSEQLIKSSNRDPRDFDPRTNGTWNFTYNPVGEATQRHDCQLLNLTYKHGNRVTPGSPDTPSQHQTCTDCVTQRQMETVCLGHSLCC